MSDLIDRQAAIDLIMETDPFWAEGMTRAIFEGIEQLPPAQPKLEQNTRLEQRENDKLGVKMGETCTDTISRQAAIDAIERAKTARSIDGEIYVAKLNAEMNIQILPPAQPEIIACGDCKHWICHDRRCGYWNHGVKPLDWCCHAERRNDERFN